MIHCLMIEKVLNLCKILNGIEITGNQKQGSIHDSGSVQHSRHKNVVTGAIDKAHMTNQLEFTVASWTVARE